MRNVMIACAISALTAGAAEPVKLDFPSANQMNFEGKTKIATGAEAEGCDFKVFSTVAQVGEKPQFVETAWTISTERMALDEGVQGYAFDFELKSDDDWKPAGGGGKWSSRILFYGPDGKQIEERPLIPSLKKGAFAHLRFSGKVPKGAKTVSFALGKDDPNILPGKTVYVRNATYTPVGAGERIPDEIVPDMRAPMVRSLFKAPTEDRNLKVVYEITDETGVDWQAVIVSNVLTKSVIPFDRKGNVITLRPDAARPAGA